MITSDGQGNMLSTVVYDDYDSLMQAHTLYTYLPQGIIMTEILRQEFQGDVKINMWERYGPFAMYLGYHQQKIDEFRIKDETYFTLHDNVMLSRWFSCNKEKWVDKISYKVTEDGKESRQLHVFYDYGKPDDQGNWTEKYIRLSDSDNKPDAPQYVTVRTIEYYDDQQ